MDGCEYIYRIIPTETNQANDNNKLKINESVSVNEVVTAGTFTHDGRDFVYFGHPLVCFIEFQQLYCSNQCLLVVIVA